MCDCFRNELPVPQRNASRIQGSLCSLCARWLLESMLSWPQCLCLCFLVCQESLPAVFGEFLPRSDSSSSRKTFWNFAPSYPLSPKDLPTSIIFLCCVCHYTCYIVSGIAVIRLYLCLPLDTKFFHGRKWVTECLTSALSCCMSAFG